GRRVRAPERATNARRRHLGRETYWLKNDNSSIIININQYLHCGAEKIRTPGLFRARDQDGVLGLCVLPAKTATGLGELRSGESRRTTSNVSEAVGGRILDGFLRVDGSPGGIVPPATVVAILAAWWGNLGMHRARGPFSSWRSPPRLS